MSMWRRQLHSLVYHAQLKGRLFHLLGDYSCQLFVVLDPAGSSIPKFSERGDLNRIVEKASTAFSLPCFAQGSPVPSFR